MQLGTIEGKVNTSTFKFRATEEVKKFDFVSVKSNDKWILAQVEEVEKKPDGETIANAGIIGYRDKGLTKAPRRVIEPDSIVYAADQELISDTLGLEEAGLRIGHLETNPEIDIHVNKEDFYKHFAVLAQTGAGKCVTPDSEIVLNDGSLEKIKDIFESSDQVIKSSQNEELRMLDGISVKAFDDSYQQVDADALYAYRKKADKILKVKTTSGREIEVTKEHPLLRAEKGYEFAKAENLQEGEHIGIPRRLDFKSNNQINISKELESKSEKESKRRKNALEKYREFCRLDEQNKGVKEMAEKLEVNKSTLENWKYRDRQPSPDKGFAIHQNSSGVQVPESFSPKFAEFLSLVISEGSEQQRDGSYRIIFTNNNQKLMERFIYTSRSLFALDTGSMRDNSRYIDSTSLKHLLEDIGYDTLNNSRSKKIPEIVLNSTPRCKKRFLRVFFDAEGCMEDHEVTVFSASRDIINSLSYMLLEFGIIARMSEREKRATNSDHKGDTYYQISISGAEQLEKFSSKIGFGIDRKQQKLESYVQNKDGNTNTDIVPVEGDYLKSERNKIGLSQKELGDRIDSHSTLVSLYERGERRPSRKKFEDLAEALDSKKYQKLADSDVYWDKIESIEEVEYDNWVYDLTVREHHNFVAGRGGVICHNSYLTGVLIEEMLEKNLPVMIIDPHGEFNSLSQPNPDNEDRDERQGYKVNEYSPNTDINDHAMPLSFSSVNMEKKELLDVIPDSLTNSQMGVLYNALKRLRDKSEDYTLNDIMDEVSNEDSTAKWNLLNSLEQLERSGLFSEDAIDLEDLLEPGEATIINLKAVEPETAEMTMFMLAKRMFQLRKENRIPPYIMVIEEAHNFAPEKGFEQALSNKILRKIASEGRKFGLGIGVISQRPARIDKNVLSQANTQFILRVTNPNDLKAISKSFEGITSEVESMIKSLPPGVAFVLGNEYPVMTDVRTRKSKHGGTTQTSENYKEKEKIKMFEPQRSRQEVETEKGEKFDETYYPLHLSETDERKVLYDAVNGDKKAEIIKVSGREKEVLQNVRESDNKSELMDEMGLSLSKITSVISSLREKDRVKDDELAIKQKIFSKPVVDEMVDEEKLIDVEKTPDELGIENSELVYYPYFSSGEEVYDPVLDKMV